MEDTSNDFVNGRQPKIFLKREDDLKLMFPWGVLHKFGLELNQKFTGDVFNKLRPRNVS
jgi:hypothetical protein